MKLSLPFSLPFVPMNDSLSLNHHFEAEDYRILLGTKVAQVHLRANGKLISA